jgi:hypothetical protein
LDQRTDARRVTEIFPAGYIEISPASAVFADAREEFLKAAQRSRLMRSISRATLALVYMANEVF